MALANLTPLTTQYSGFGVTFAGLFVDDKVAFFVTALVAPAAFREEVAARYRAAWNCRVREAKYDLPNHFLRGDQDCPGFKTGYAGFFEEASGWLVTAIRN